MTLEPDRGEYGSFGLFAPVRPRRDTRRMRSSVTSLAARFAYLFRRFAHAQIEITRRGFTISDVAGRRLAQVDRISLRRGNLIVEGWSEAKQLRLEGPDTQVACQPNLDRWDVVERFDTHAQVGFALSLPLHTSHLAHPFALHVDDRPATRDAMQTSMSHRFVPFPWHHRALPVANVAAKFSARVLAALPEILAAKLERRALNKGKLKRLFGFEQTLNGHQLDPDILLNAPPPPPAKDTPITIVVPVFNAFDDLQDCLARVERHTDVPWRIVIVEDASTDERVRRWLRAWVSGQGARARLIEHQENQGFVSTVNHAVQHAMDDPASDTAVVLLNTDAFVPKNWASRLIRPILRDHRVASATPMSNNAELLTVPRISAPVALSPGQADRLDRAAERLAPGGTYCDIPTGVGFCMALNPRWLEKAPGFDPTFGPGYGEEVDWCQRLRRLGARHVGVHNLFVEHRGSASFGSEEKCRLIARNSRLLAYRFPRFDQEVQDFIATDDLATARLALTIAWAGERAVEVGADVPIYFAHSMGGGAEKCLQRSLREDCSRGLAPIIIRVGGPSRWRVEVVTKVDESLSCTVGVTNDRGVLLRLFDDLPTASITYSCGVSDPDPVTIPDLLASLASGQNKLRVLIHDYFVVSPSYTLLGSDGVFSGVPSAQSSDPAHGTIRPDGSLVPLSSWRSAWEKALTRADTVTAFSESSRDHLVSAFPALRNFVDVVPHSVDCLGDPVLRQSTSGPHVIGVLGNINAAKGAALLAPLAKALQTNGSRLVVIGNVDPVYPVPASVRVHGTYDPAHIPALAARYGITQWLIPSIWPETFCFTAHEALATGLPTYAFDLGAQGEAVAQHPNGHAIPYHPATCVAAAAEALT